MNAQKTPPRQTTTSVAGGSHPDLSKLSSLTVDPQITFRKRKQPIDHECECATEMKEIRAELSRIGLLFEKYAISNEQIMTKMQESLTEVKTDITNLKSCNEQIAASIRENTKQINEIKTSTSGMITEHRELKNTVSQLEKQLSSGEHNTVKHSSESSTFNFQNQLFLNETIIKEVADRNYREKNIIVVGLPEQRAASAEERVSRDEADILKMTSQLNQDLPKPIKILRIGKYFPGKSRGLKVCYETAVPAKYLLRNREKLPENIKIFSDQTPAQQKYLKNLKEELIRRQNDGENELTIKYINGTPTIIKTTSKNYAQ